MLLSICMCGEEPSLGSELARLFTGCRRRQAISLLSIFVDFYGAAESRINRHRGRAIREVTGAGNATEPQGEALPEKEALHEGGGESSGLQTDNNAQEELSHEGEAAREAERVEKKRAKKARQRAARAQAAAQPQPPQQKVRPVQLPSPVWIRQIVYAGCCPAVIAQKYTQAHAQAQHLTNSFTNSFTCFYMAKGRRLL